MILDACGPPRSVSDNHLPPVTGFPNSLEFCNPKSLVLPAPTLRIVPKPPLFGLLPASRNRCTDNIPCRMLPGTILQSPCGIPEVRHLPEPCEFLSMRFNFRSIHPKIGHNFMKLDFYLAVTRLDRSRRSASQQADRASKVATCRIGQTPVCGNLRFTLQNQPFDRWKN